MASEEDDSHDSALAGHRGATPSASLPAANEPEENSDAGDADERTLTVPDRHLAVAWAGLAERPQEMLNVWIKHPDLGWGWIKSFNKKTGDYKVMFKGNRNAKTMQANELARIMTNYVGKGTTTHCCISHTSKMYAMVHSITFGEEDDLHVTFYFYTRADDKYAGTGGDMSLRDFRGHFIVDFYQQATPLVIQDDEEAQDDRLTPWLVLGGAL